MIKPTETVKTRYYTSVIDFVIRRMPGFVSFIFAMLISRELAGFPFYGAIWFLTGQVALMGAEAYYRMFKALFSPKRRLFYAVLIALAALCCVTATVIFLRGMRSSSALAILVFTVNELAGVAMLEGSSLLPMPEHRKMAVNLSSFAAVSAASLLIIRYVSCINSIGLMIAYDAVFLVLLCIKHIVHMPGVDLPQLKDEPALDGFETIYAYRQYRRMAANTLTSVEISIMLLASYLLAQPNGSRPDALLMSAQLLAIFGVSIWACRILLNRKRVKALGSDIAFFLFALLWIYINFYTAAHPMLVTESRWILLMVVASLCMAALSAILLNMDRYMVIIGELGALGSDGSRYSLFKNAAYHRGAVVSRVVFLVFISAVTVFYELTSIDVFLSAAETNRNKLFVLPLIFLVPAAVSALQQPLTKYYEQKLGRYSVMKLSGKVSRALEQKLVLSLVKKNGKRIGIKLLRAAVKPFVTLKVIGVDKVNPKMFPSVFVCNHAEIFGPIAATVNIPFFNRPWIIEEMVDREKIAAHLQTGFDHWRLPAFIRNRLGKLMGPIVLWGMRSMDPIPVYRNTIKDIAKTITLSTEALESDDNILIFPENPSASNGRYVIDGVGEFFEGFVNIARQYCRNTGKPLVFYSVYADAKKRTIRFSNGIEFNPAAPFADERERISGYLHAEMVLMHNEE